jgi:O-antigen/teichoic acid export membrane protein
MNSNALIVDNATESHATVARQPRPTGTFGPGAGLGVERLSLKANVCWTIVGNTGVALSQWGVLVAIARSGDIVAVGHFALALALTAPVFIAAGMQLRTIQATDVERRYPFGEFLGQRICAAMAALLIATLLAFQYERVIWWPIVLMAGAKALESISDIVSGVFQSFERMDMVARSTLLRGWLSLAAVVVCLPFTRELTVLIGALLLARAIVLVAYDLRRCRDFVSTLKPRFNLRRIAVLTKVAAPLGFVSMMTSMNVNIPRYQIEKSLGPAELGVFSALSYMLVLAQLIASAVGQSATPRLAATLTRGDTRGFAILSGKLALLLSAGGAAVIAGAYFAGPTLLTLFYGPTYAAYANVFTMLAIATAVSLPASIVSYCTLATQAFAVQVPIAIATVLVTYGASVWLIQSSGLVGASSVLIVTASVQLVLTVGALIKVFLRKRSQIVTNLG